MTQKFYLHDAITSDTGTLPNAFQTAPAVTAVGGNVNRSMDGTIGAGPQITATVAATTAQTNAFRRFLSTPLVAQTIAAANWTIGVASDTNSGFSGNAPQIRIYIWRPSTGAKVGDIVASPSAWTGTPGDTSEAGWVGTIAGSAVTVLDGDVLVVEIYDAVIFFSTSNTDRFYYDGNVDPVDATLATSAASYVQAPVDLPLAVVATVGTSIHARGARWI